MWATIAAALAAVAVGGRAHASAEPARAVVFVCQHGNVKSVIAAQWFNRLAARRGSRLRALARGMEPTGRVPEKVAAELRREGFEVGGLEAEALDGADLVGAARVVAIGVDTGAVTTGGRVPVEDWQGIPPASERYGEASAALRARVEALLERLEPRASGQPGSRRE
jgi:protein-tyrosine-phosphatase